MFIDSKARRPTHAICDKHDKFDNIVEQTNYKLTKSPVIGDAKLTKYTQYARQRVYCLQSTVYCLNIWQAMQEQKAIDCFWI